VQINADYYEDLDKDSFGKILDNLAAGKKVKPGPQIDRQLSAPVGGPLTLLNGKGDSRRHAAGDEPKDDKAKKPGAAANIREAPVQQDRQKK
jgi:NADH-quinone oxidoreductase subunit E